MAHYDLLTLPLVRGNKKMRKQKCRRIYQTNHAHICFEDSFQRSDNVPGFTDSFYNY